VCSTSSPNTPGADGATFRTRITHPFHLLYGRELVVVDHRRSRHGDRVWYKADDGSIRSVALAWTSLAVVDPFEVISAGRTRFRPDDLVRLAALLDDLRAQATGSGGAHEL
jgi:uncharacterized protein (DUF58 family)